jgi:hypothetical protein
VAKLTFFALSDFNVKINGKAVLVKYHKEMHLAWVEVPLEISNKNMLEVLY